MLSIYVYYHDYALSGDIQERRDDIEGREKTALLAIRASQSSGR